MDRSPSPKTFKLEDVYFVLFRRKWLILIFCIAGLVAAAAAWKFTPRLFTSKAKLLVRYVVEGTAVVPPGGDEQIRQADHRGESILDTEVNILTSQDLIRDVVEAVGPDRILGHAGAGVGAASASIRSGLVVNVPRKSTTMQVSFSHEDADVTSEVLEQLTTLYQKKHKEIHQSGNTYELIARKTDEMRLRLRETEDALEKLRAETDGISIVDAKKTIAGELEHIRQSILDTESALAANRAISPLNPATGVAKQPAAVEGGSPVVDGATNQTKSAASEVEYAALVERLKALRAREQDYLSRFTEENPLVRRTQEQIVALEKNVQIMLDTNPRLALTATPSSAGRVDGAGASPAETAAILAAQLTVLTNQLSRVRAESVRLSELENRISEVQLSRDIQEENLRYAATALEQARYKSSLELGQTSNISVVQEPSIPAMDMDSAKKATAIAFGGLTGLGLALAFLLEMLLDRRLKRPSQLGATADMPVLMTIPRVDRKVVADMEGVRLLKTKAGDELAQPAGVAAAVPALNGKHAEFRTYFEGLRDRLIIYFESIHLRRKPKLVGVAGCHRGCGTSTVAETLAATLSETGGGKVLLVDLNVGMEVARSYRNGAAAPHLRDLLSIPADKSEVDGNGLVLARVDREAQGVHPVRTREFDQLLPKLKASDFDYVVFDLPPVTPTSITVRMSGFLDKILLVAESEKTHVETVGRVASLLRESNSRVGVVLNKTREYLPQWLREPV